MGTKSIPWIYWSFQYGEKLKPTVQAAKSKRISAYADQYFALITSDLGGYTNFAKYKVFPKLFMYVGTCEGIYEYHYIAFLQPPPKAAPFHMLVNSVSRVAKLEINHEELKTLAKAIGPEYVPNTENLPVLFSATTGSPGTGTPPPPSKPNG
jgi:hypothetical protein